ncbi:MAG: hypothetical protein WD468_09075 [Pirellulales bacterium]
METPKERLLAQGHGQATMIRFHRARSWLARVEIDSDSEDLALISRRIAFNSLDGQWDEVKRNPLGAQGVV